jgi:hypothetical protein
MNFLACCKIEGSGKRTREEDLDHIADMILAEGGSLRVWLSRLQALEEVDLLHVREHNWFRVFRDPKVTAMEKLNQLVGLEEVKQKLLKFPPLRSKIQQHLTRISLLHLVLGNQGQERLWWRLVGEII